jgi:hypothetical protein
LYPAPYAAEGVRADDFEQDRTRNELRAIFADIGHVFKDEEFTGLCQQCINQYGVLSVSAFRTLLNRNVLGITRQHM